LIKTWAHLPYAWLAPVKDFLQVALWFASFTGNRVEWAGQKMRLTQTGELEAIAKPD